MKIAILHVLGEMWIVVQGIGILRLWDKFKIGAGVDGVFIFIIIIIIIIL